MKYLIEKDKKRREIFAKYENFRICLRALSKDLRLPYSVRLLYRVRLAEFYKNASKTRIKNRCVISGRGRGIFRFFRMSRLQIRDTSIKGLLYGIRRSSW